jgi:predicted Abi (CAAX) family protease
MMPRRAHDDLAKLFITRGADLQILRTNQLPGMDTSIEPLAPTLVLGQIPILATILRRLVDAVFAPLTMASWLQAGLLLGGFTVLVVPPGLHNGFLRWQRPHGPPASLIAQSAALLVMPAVVEELIFRVALLPHRYEGAAWWELAGWGLLSVGLYVAYHPVAARLWYPAGRGVFDDPRFLVPCTWLGIQLSAVYLLTGSLWMPTLSHWLVVLAWLKGLGGDRILHRRTPGIGGMR